MVGGSRGHTSPRAFSMLARMALGAVLWYFRVSLVAQMVKNLPAMLETQA